jgi:hypothetical protein
MLKKAQLFLILILLFRGAIAQKIATLEVEIPQLSSGFDLPVQIDLDPITFASDSLLQLVELEGNKRTPVSFQIEQGKQRILHWIVPAGSSKAKKRVFELVKSRHDRNSNLLKTKDENGTLTIQSGDKNLLRYQYSTLYPPSGVDTAYKRSGFIHPLWTPRGQELTRIQAPDHYHHYGIWNPWTHTLFEGDTVDFWNLAKKEGTVRFAEFVSLTNGSVFSEYKALQQHVAFKKDGTEKVALNELQSVRVYKPHDEEYYFFDMDINMNCASNSPLMIFAYRYEGLGWRATEKWNKDNSEVITSEGKNRKDADGTTARWCIVQGSLDSDYGGAVMMSYPTNYNHPEPLRIWPENMYNRGDMFASFSTTKTKDWLLEPGKTYNLKYRFVVFNGRFTKEKAEAAWQHFSAPPRVTVKLN